MNIHEVNKLFMSKRPRRARFFVSDANPERVLIVDVGPWSEHPTITNDAEGVVADMVPHLNGRRLYYQDSEGDVDELVIKDGKFEGFAFIQRG